MIVLVFSLSLRILNLLMMKTYLYVLWIAYSILFLVSLWLYVSDYTSTTSFVLFASTYALCCIYMIYSLRTLKKK